MEKIAEERRRSEWVCEGEAEECAMRSEGRGGRVLVVVGEPGPVAPNRVGDPVGFGEEETPGDTVVR